MMSHCMMMEQAKVFMLNSGWFEHVVYLFFYAEDVMITLPLYSITYKHFAELCNGELINMEVRIIMTFIIRSSKTTISCQLTGCGSILDPSCYPAKN